MIYAPAVVETLQGLRQQLSTHFLTFVSALENREELAPSLQKIETSLQDWDNFLPRDIDAAYFVAASRTVDSYSEGRRLHSENLATIAMIVAYQMGALREERLLVGMAGLLHDISLLVQLNDPGPVAGDHHALQSSRLLGSLKYFSADMLRLVEEVHEQIDGQGVPSG